MKFLPLIYPVSLILTLALSVAGGTLLLLPIAEASAGTDEGRRKMMGGLHSPRHEMTDCPRTGCVMIPRDVGFDAEAKVALEALRALGDATVAAAESGPEADAADDGADPSEDRHDGYAASAASALSELISAGRGDAATLTLVGFKGGKIESQINQDRSFVISPYRLGGGDDVNPQDGGSRGRSGGAERARILGVFDGHAKLGELVSQHVVSELPALLASKLEEEIDLSLPSHSLVERADQIKRILVETFVELDRTAPADKGGGCTASVVLQLGDEVYVANAGDSRSFLAAYVPAPSVPHLPSSSSSPSSDAEGRGLEASEGGVEEEEEEEGTEDGTVIILYATREDKPHLPDERSRIESRGGTVMVPPPERLAAGATSRVMYVDSSTGAQYGLAMSRSIGDWDVRGYGVVPDPIVEVFSLREAAEEAAARASKGEGCDGQKGAEAEMDESGEPIVSSPSSAFSSGGAGEACTSSMPSPIDPSSVELFAVSATDGLLDYVSLDIIAEHVARGLYDPEGPHPLTACEDLVATAAGGWHRSKGGRYRDDIAVAVSKMSFGLEVSSGGRSRYDISTGLDGEIGGING